jgi:nucleoside-diphosphate-sugar epimerase
MIFILGGNGFIGSAFSRICIKQNLEHHIITKENYAKYSDRSCDVFINANGSSSKLLGNKDPKADFDANVKSTRDTLVDFKFKKYVLISSCDVYPDCSSPATTSEDFNIDVSKQSVYGFHKYLAEQCVQNTSERWLIMRLGGMVGIGIKKNAIFDILYGDKIWLNPESKLQFINTDDVAQITIDLLEKKINNETYNLCGDGLVKLQDVINRVGKHIQIVANSPNVVYNVNVSKIKKIISLPKSIETVNKFVDEMI